MVHSMPNVTEKVKSALSSLTLQHDGKAIPLVDSAVYKEARTIPELLKSLSPYWNCLSTSILETVVNNSDCSISASALRDFTSTRSANGHLVLAVQAGTTSGDQKAHHSDFSLSHKSAQPEELQSSQPAVFARLTEHLLCASVNVTRISVEVATDVLHLSDYDSVTEAVIAFLKLPVAALVYCGCSESPLAVCWEISRALVAHITSVVPSNSLYRQLAKQNIIRLAVGDDIKYSCPSIKVRGRRLR